MHSEWLEFHLIPLHCWASFPVVLWLNTVCPFSLFLIWLFNSHAGYTVFVFVCATPLVSWDRSTKRKCSQMNLNFSRIAVQAGDWRSLSLLCSQGNTGCQSLMDQLIDASICFSILQKSLQLPPMTEGHKALRTSAQWHLHCSRRKSGRALCENQEDLSVFCSFLMKPEETSNTLSRLTELLNGLGWKGS